MAVLLVALLGSAIVGAGAWYWHARNVSQAQAQFRTQADELSGDVSNVLLRYEDLLSGSAALFHQGVVTRAEYDAFLGSVGFGSSRFPGLLGAGLIKRVLADQLPAFLASLRADGIAVGSISPPGRRAAYCLGSYADWSNLSLTIPLFGYDFCTVAPLAKVLSQATTTAQEQALNGRVLGPDYGPDFVLVQPVYSGSPSSVAQRQERVTGWVLAIVNGAGLLKSIPLAQGVQFIVSAAASGGRQAQPVLRAPLSVTPGGTWAFSRRIDGYGSWSIRFRAAKGSPLPGGGLTGPLVLLALGLLAVGLLSSLLGNQSRARARAQKEVAEATRSLRSSEQRFRKLLANSNDLIAIVNENAELIYANPAGERMLGREPAESVGRNMIELIHPDDIGRAAEAFARDISTRGPNPPGTYRFRTGANEWRLLEVVGTNCLDEPAIGGMVINARDVTDNVRLARAQRTLSATIHVVVHAVDESTLLADVCRMIVEVSDCGLAWVGYVEHDEASTIRPVAWTGIPELKEKIPLSWADNELGQGPAGVAVRTRSIQVVNDLRLAPYFAARQATNEKYHLRSCCAIPLEIAGEVVGVLGMYASSPGEFDTPEVTLMAELASELAFGMERLRNAGSLRASEERFRALADAAPIGIVEDPGDGVNYANPRIGEICGRDPEALMGRGWVEAVHPDDRAELLAFIERHRPGRTSVTTTFRILRPDGEVRHVRMSNAPKGLGRDEGYVTTIEDITDEVHAREELTHQAFYDALTGLPNRALFLDRLEQELARHRRKGSNIAVLFLDLDRFKLVNDSLGHETGDAVLKEVGERFMRATREGETAARFGGDEFMFIIREVKNVEGAVTAAKRLLALLEPPVRSGGHDLTVTGSIGIVIPASSCDAAMVLRDADTAMYQAKDAGRNTYAIFDEGLHRRSIARLTLESELRRALERGEFEVYYQPVVEPVTGRPFAAEALIRWNHPTRGLVPPLDFIPVAEDSGLVRPIGNWVFEEAMAQLAAWDCASDGPRLQVLAVNLSAQQLDDPHTAGIVREAIERFGITPARVALEITESVLMADNASTRSSLRVFKDLGLRVAIDDFGTGYSSLAYLHTLPVTTVKVDRSFVSRLGSEDDSAPVVHSIIEMSHAMGLLVVAEGVEDELQRALVSDLGSDLAQGYYWARPMPAGEFADLWRRSGQQRAGTPRPTRLIKSGRG
ncbi:MAG TPA: EAL domain-containing protein [Acidimicrobiales bacterium]|nr:EAL domain-containing protein [Acidimicrobiales bacterium]